MSIDEEIDEEMIERLEEKINALVGQKQWDNMDSYDVQEAILGNYFREVNWEDDAAIDLALLYLIGDFFSMADTCGMETELLKKMNQVRLERLKEIKDEVENELEDEDEEITSDTFPSAADLTVFSEYV